MKIAIVFAALVTLTGCGSISRGTTEKVTITSTPADAEISTSNGHSCRRSPCTISVKRKEEFTAYAEKPGYQKGALEIKTKVSGGGAAGFAGNVLVGGVIGMGVDAATGAALDHYPNPAHIDLKPNGSKAHSKAKASKPVKPSVKKPSGKPSV
ncbi:translation initiation factor 2 [Brucella sp. H1_1004]|uniref:translation initiation factor 2 n=1 Tax=Brucella sp. H1_1004 TaxID=3110109 RepID=UPI0039B51017